MARKPDAFKHQRNYAVELRIADGPWYLAGPVCESKAQAESIGAMLAKWWLGAAAYRASEVKRSDESRVVPLKRANTSENAAEFSNVKPMESLFAQLAGF